MNLIIIDYWLDTFASDSNVERIQVIEVVPMCRFDSESEKIDVGHFILRSGTLIQKRKHGRLKITATTFKFKLLRALSPFQHGRYRIVNKTVTCPDAHETDMRQTLF